VAVVPGYPSSPSASNIARCGPSAHHQRNPTVLIQAPQKRVRTGQSNRRAGPSAYAKYCHHRLCADSIPMIVRRVHFVKRLAEISDGSPWFSRRSLGVVATRRLTIARPMPTSAPGRACCARCGRFSGWRGCGAGRVSSRRGPRGPRIRAGPVRRRSWRPRGSPGLRRGGAPVT